MTRRYRIPIIVFLAGTLAALLVLFVPKAHGIVDLIPELGQFGALLGGVLYAQSFTAPIATVVFSSTPATMNPLVVALLGGIGALLYDLGVFLVVRKESHTAMIESLKAKLSGKRRLPAWAQFLIGTAILASPLPDELAAGFFGFSRIRTRHFLAISFAANALGILIIILAV